MKIELDENGCPRDCDMLIGREFVHFKGKRYPLASHSLTAFAMG